MTCITTACGDDEPDTPDTPDTPTTRSPQLQFTQGGDDKTIDHNKGVVECDLSGNIPYEQLVAETDADWCKATLKNTSQSDASGYYTYHLQINVEANLTQDQREATVKITNKDNTIERKFKIIQIGNQPYAIMPNGGDVSVNADGRTLTRTIETNVPISAFSVTTSQSTWSSVTLKDVTKTGDFPYVYEMAVKLDENISDKKRTTVVTVNISQGNLEGKYAITQSAATLTLSKTVLGFDKNAATRKISVSASNSWEATSSASWCKVEQSGSSLVVTVTAATSDRTATITFKERSDKIVINQTKYTVGETYNENGVTGTVAYIGDDKRFICRHVSGSNVYKWSTSSSITGANSLYDGYSNTQKIHEQPSWRVSYPAFAVADELNVGGETGWYVPAIDELSNMLPFVSTELSWYNEVVSSTEGAAISGGVYFPSENFQAIIYSYGSWKVSSGFKTSERYHVYAIRQF